jgi:L-alanine-DL-glutamate epimerase-like enolase superfamily enzyme
MRIAKASFTPLRLELLQPLKTSRSTHAAREGFLVRLEDEAGHVGLGEAMPLPEFGTESLADCGATLEAWLAALKGQFLGDSVRAIEDTLSPFPPAVARGDGVRIRSRQATPEGPMPASEHALELALLDLLAQRQGVPLCWLLAEEARTEVAVNALLIGDGPEALAEDARKAVAEGYGTLKLKVAGRSLEDDEQRVKAVREAVGPDVKLRLDDFESLFGTPHGVDLSHAAALGGARLHRPRTPTALRAAVREGLEGGLHLVEVRVDRAANVDEHRQLFARMAAALGDGPWA